MSPKMRQNIFFQGTLLSTKKTENNMRCAAFCMKMNNCSAIMITSEKTCFNYQLKLKNGNSVPSNGNENEVWYKISKTLDMKDLTSSVENIETTESVPMPCP